MDITRICGYRAEDVIFQKNNLGLALLKQGKFNEAIEAFKSCGAGSKESICNMAHCYMNLKDVQMASQCLDKAIKIDPLYFAAVFNKIQLLTDLKKYTSALELIDEYSKAGGNNPEILELKESLQRMPLGNDDLLADVKMVLNKVKNEVTSTHDVISQFTFSGRLNIDGIKHVINEFGFKKFLVFIDCVAKAEAGKAMLQLAMDKIIGDLVYPKLSLYIAMSYQGVGECQVVSSRALLELSKAGVNCYCRQYFLKNRSEKDGHAILVISKEVVHGILQVADFSHLSDDVILFDPFFNIVGQANQIEKLLGDYLKANKINDVFVLQDPFCLDNNFPSQLIEREAKHLFNTIIEPKIIGKNLYKFDDFTFARIEEAYKVVKNNLLELLKKDSSARSKGIHDAVEKNDYTLAFRKACGFGRLDVVKKILEITSEKGMLDCTEEEMTLIIEVNPTMVERIRALRESIQFNINGFVSSNNLTALDWANTRPESSEKKALIKEIKDAGAKTYSELKSL